MRSSSSLFVLAAAVAFALGSVNAPKAASSKLVLDPEKRAMEKHGWTYIGMADGTLIYMRDAVPGSAADGAKRVLTAYEALTPQDQDGFTFRSVQSLGEFDCENGRTRVLRETYFKEASLKGETFIKPDASADPEWSDVIEGSVGLMRIVFACRERPLA